MDCLYCGKKISVLRKLKNDEFCSVAHRKAYLKKQNDDALDFLIKSKPRVTPKRPAEPKAAKPPVPEPQPILVCADFLPEPVAPGVARTSAIRNAKPVCVPSRAILPAIRWPAEPGPRFSGFAHVALSADLAPGASRPAAQGPVEFAIHAPRVAGPVIRPIWMVSERQAPTERPRAGFVPVRPTLTHLTSQPARSGATARFAIAPALAGAELAPRIPVLRMARTGRSSIVAAGGDGCVLERNRTAWRHPQAALQAPKVSIGLPASALCRSEWLAVKAPHATPAPARGPAAIACRPMAQREQPVTPAFQLVLRTPLLRPAPRAPQDAPRATAAAAPIAGQSSTLIWKFPIRVGTFTRVAAIPPRFEAPKPSFVARSFEREPTGRAWRQIAGLWGSASAWSRGLAVAVPLAAVLVVGVSRFSASAPAQRSRDAMLAIIGRRATIEIQDDFRAGLSQWTGLAGWANTWSYDATGFARPGRLALLAGSLPLTDYRLEFLAQIDKKALGWVFRASDPRNYYAMKLVESKRGPAAAFSLVRYAVMDGRERLRVQLPLPIAASPKTLFRVRQEIRGAQFTTFMDGRLVDTWSDSSLTRGGVGFFADAGEAAYVRWVDVARNDDFLGRVCSYLAPARPR
jgi:hypothetical protein